MTPVIGALVALAGRLRAAHREATGGAPHFFAVALLILAVFGAAHVGRFGTLGARAAGAGIVATTVVVVLVAWVVARRRWKDARVAVRRIVGAEDPPLGAAIDRATGLALRAHGDVVEGKVVAETGELAALHLDRQIGKVRVERVFDRSSKRAQKTAAASLGLAAIATGVVMLDPIRVVEGADVVLARGGEAPIALVYLDDVDILATPPTYLGEHEQAVYDFEDTEQPRGTVLTVRGKPVHDGRSLVLTDGFTEVPFVDDGKGHVLARWTLAESTNVRVAARFGGVRISQKDVLEIESIPDLAPTVSLEGAPRTVKLVDTPSVSLKYEATDDHGLREIALVLRAGTKEERRTLSKPLSDARSERGAYELSTREPFFKKSFIPVEVTVEAKDNDGVLGPKWGRSAGFIIVPPVIGEPEALRFAALVRARDALVDLAAPRVTTEIASIQAAKARVETEKRAQDTAMSVVDEVLAGTYGGLGVKGRVRRVFAGQLRRLREGLKTFEDKPSKETYDTLRTTTEDVVLAIDSAIRGLGVEDARKVAKRLADVADEAGFAAHAALAPEDLERAQPRLAASMEVLESAGKELAHLGDLGADLGDLVRAGTGRIGRERDASRWALAELAAKDLAERLRDPRASVGGGGRPGVESGVGDGSEAGEGDASEADAEAEQGARELEELVERHQEEIARVEDAMERATTAEEREALRKLAKEHAEAIREAVKDLPEQGVPGSASQKGAEAKQRAESMAGSLEQGDIKEALKAGKEALEALREATRLGEQGTGYFDDEEIARQARGAGNRVEEALDQLEQARKAADQSAREGAKKDLEEAGGNERRLSEKAQDLSKRGEKGDASMPDEMLEKLQQAEEAMKDAAKALEEGDGERGAEKQREAQRLLEMARGEDEERPPGDEDGDDGEDGDGRRMAQDADVPDKDKHKGPEEFRKRVMEGLGKPGDARLREAIKRYAEGLLK